MINSPDTPMSKKKAQVAIEFLLLLSLSFFVVIALLAAVLSVSKTDTSIKVYTDLDDLGKSLQQEVLLASQMEDGYVRRINLPETVNGADYNVSIGHAASYNDYISLTYDTIDIYYIIPPTNGTFSKGTNYIKKNDGALRVSS